MLQFFGFGSIIISGDKCKECLFNGDFPPDSLKFIFCSFFVGAIILLWGGVLNSKKAEGK